MSIALTKTVLHDLGEAISLGNNEPLLGRSRELILDLAADNVALRADLAEAVEMLDGLNVRLGNWLKAHR